MILRKKLLLAYTLFIVITPLKPSLYSLFVELVGWIIGGASCYLLYSYYKSGPPSRQTSLNTTMRLLMVVNFMLQMCSFIRGLLFHGFPETTRYMFHTYPTIICSILSPRYTEILNLITFAAVLILKCWLTIFPYNFINSNHENIFKLVFVSVVGGTCFEVCVSILFYGTLCPKNFLTTLNTLHGYELDETKIRRSSILLPLVMLIGLIAEVTSRMYTKFQKYKKKRRKLSKIPLDPHSGRVMPLILTIVEKGKLIAHNLVGSIYKLFYLYSDAN